MSAQQPWMKFYPQDWRADEKLRMCSLAARGLWVEMLALMHRSERYGQLLINGLVPTDAQLAVQVGAPVDQVTALLEELDVAGVFSRSSGGTLYSRRMTRDAKKAKIARSNGKNGGNPNLRKHDENSSSDKGEDNGQVKGEDKPQIPEARSQRPETPKPPEPVELPPAVRAVMEAGGFVAPPSDLGLLRQWEQAGADFEQDVLPTVRAVSKSVRERSGRAPFKLQLFDQPIREKLAADAREIERLKGIARRMGSVG